MPTGSIRVFVLIFVSKTGCVFFQLVAWLQCGDVPAQDCLLRLALFYLPFSALFQVLSLLVSWIGPWVSLAALWDVSHGTSEQG